ncbi:MAG TPA: protein kinase, partial [Terriglobales bacterium]|nr:protein kinase [Terriglobales bacterium]
MSYGVEQLLANRGEIDAELRKQKSPVTVMFTDLAGSTSYFDRFGDTAGVAWIEEHYRSIFPTVEQLGGVVVKTIGDSVMAYFRDPAQATAAAVAIQNSFLVSNRDRDLQSHMHVRVALHHGLAYLRGADVFGDVVNVAARIAKACLPAQILVSEAVYVGAQQAASAEFRQVGSVQLRGKAASENMYEVLWTDENTYRELRRTFPAKPASLQEELTGGRYMILSELGRGAMGVVYKAYDRLIGRLVALKTIPVEASQNEYAALVERLKQEARAAGMLDHPNIVTVFDVGEEAGLFYLTMQFVEGRTLADLRQQSELMPVSRIYEVADQICDAVGFAHRAGVIHRDLKPSNMMLTVHGTVKVMDFGIAKLGDAGLTKAGMILGTPSYLAPEQAAGRRIDHRSDIFSLGSVLYEVITGEKAFPGESTTSIIYKVINEDPIPPRIIEPSLPPGLDAIVRKALAKDPTQRFQTCEQMREALQQCKEGRTLETQKLPKEPDPVRPRRWGWVAAAVVLVGLGLAVAWWHSRMSPSAASKMPVPSTVSAAPAPPASTALPPATAATPSSSFTGAQPESPANSPARNDARAGKLSPAQPAQQSAEPASYKPEQSSEHTKNNVVSESA